MATEEQVVPRLIRHGRVRIVSKDGYAHNAEVTDEATGQHLLRVANMQISIKPGDIARAQLTCLMAELDVLTDAEMTLVTSQVLALCSRLRQAAKLLEEVAHTTPALTNDVYDSLIEHANNLRVAADYNAPQI